MRTRYSDGREGNKVYEGMAGGALVAFSIGAGRGLIGREGPISQIEFGIRFSCIGLLLGREKRKDPLPASRHHADEPGLTHGQQGADRQHATVNGQQTTAECCTRVVTRLLGR